MIAPVNSHRTPAWIKEQDPKLKKEMIMLIHFFYLIEITMNEIRKHGLIILNQCFKSLAYNKDWDLTLLNFSLTPNS